MRGKLRFRSFYLEQPKYGSWGLMQLNQVIRIITWNQQQKFSWTTVEAASQTTSQIWRIQARARNAIHERGARSRAQRRESKQINRLTARSWSWSRSAPRPTRTTILHLFSRLQVRSNWADAVEIGHAGREDFQSLLRPFPIVINILQTKAHYNKKRQTANTTVTERNVFEFLEQRKIV